MTARPARASRLRRCRAREPSTDPHLFTTDIEIRQRHDVTLGLSTSRSAGSPRRRPHLIQFLRVTQCRVRRVRTAWLSSVSAPFPADPRGSSRSRPPHAPPSHATRLVTLREAQRLTALDQPHPPVSAAISSSLLTPNIKPACRYWPARGGDATFLPHGRHLRALSPAPVRVGLEYAESPSGERAEGRE